MSCYFKPYISAIFIFNCGLAYSIALKKFRSPHDSIKFHSSLNPNNGYLTLTHASEVAALSIVVQGFLTEPAGSEY